MSRKIFVYGTLMRGMAHEELLAARRDVKFLGPAVTRGRLFILGDHPGLTPGGREMVAGELFHIDETEEVLHTLDQFESESGFERRLIKVRCRQQDSEAWAYIYKGDLSGVAPIRGGSWKSFVKDNPGRGTEE